MKSTNNFHCPSCKQIFHSQRALSQHFIQSCQYVDIPININHSRAASPHFVLNPYSRRSKIQSPPKRNKVSHTKSYPTILETLPNTDCRYENLDNNTDLNVDNSKANNTPIQFSNTALLQQQKNFNIRSAKSSKDMHSLAEIDLLKILSDLNCHNAAYEHIMNWAKYWNSKEIYFKNSSYYTFFRREVVIRKLSERYDMDAMKPTINTVNVSTDDSVLQNVSVTSFDFQQQVLSLLRDKELMHPSNLVLETEPGCSPNFYSDKVSEICHSDWYKNAYNYFIQHHGPVPNRLICGIILAIDKTHTDTKGKLCLESVNFTLSIFNTETRRNNPKAWRSLGFINDLYAKHGTGIKEIFLSDDTKVDVSYRNVVFICIIFLCL